GDLSVQGWRSQPKPNRQSPVTTVSYTTLWDTTAVAARRQLAEVAEHEVAVVVLAANSLRTNPLLVSLSATELLWRANEELRRQNGISEHHRHAARPMSPRYC
ncbi:hypothetical protein, partial [Bosea massiliensis]